MKNKDIIFTTIIIIAALISIDTILKVNKNHENNLLLVTEKKITEAAEKCFMESKCPDNSKITLQNLYDNGYLTEVANPISKEVYNSNSYVSYSHEKYVFTAINW